MTILRKRALSSAGAVARSLRRRAVLLAAVDAGPRQLSLFQDEDHEPADEEPSLALATPGLDDRPHEVRWLHVLAEAADAAAHDEAKRRFLKRLLARVQHTESAIVFTEYRDTLIELARDHPGARQLHGGLSRRDRDAVQREFNEKGGLLLATDAAAEGLNLQQRCRLVINYELPWNPGRLEQRIGRVDRIGQRRAVHAITLVARDTAEDLVLANIVRRLSRVAMTLGAGDRLAAFLDEMRTAQIVIGGAPASDLQPSVGTAALVAVARQDGNAETSGEGDEGDGSAALSARSEAARLDLARRLSARVGRMEAERVPIACAKRSVGISPGLLFVFRWRLVTATGDPCASDIVSIHVPCLVSAPRTRGGARALVHEAAAARHAAEDLARREAVRARTRAMLVHLPALDAAIAREYELQGRGSSGSVIQPGLFDARALHEADAARGLDAWRLAEHQRRLRRLQEMHVPDEEVGLAAVLIVPAWG